MAGGENASGRRVPISVRSAHQFFPSAERPSYQVGAKWQFSLLCNRIAPITEGSCCVGSDCNEAAKAEQLSLCSSSQRRQK